MSHSFTTGTTLKNGRFIEIEANESTVTISTFAIDRKTIQRFAVRSVELSHHDFWRLAKELRSITSDGYEGV